MAHFVHVCSFAYECMYVISSDCDPKECQLGLVYAWSVFKYVCMYFLRVVSADVRVCVFFACAGGPDAVFARQAAVFHVLNVCGTARLYVRAYATRREESV
jgi:hypothetical protein